LTCKPFSPCISIGRKPVSDMTCTLIDNAPLMPEINIFTCSSVGGMMPFPLDGKLLFPILFC